jgi:hypothetical protein
MLDLQSDRWSKLSHAYGSASDIPALLRELKTYPPNEGYESEPYFSLWSSLCHQGDVYTASYAAVPHIIESLASKPARANWNYFLLPICIEIARSKGSGPIMPPDLVEDYFRSLAQLPSLAALVAEGPLDETYCGTLAAAIAVAGGHPTLGEAILELEPDVVPKFLEWKHDL